MSLEIGSAISTGVEKLTTTAGVQLAAIYAVLGFVSSLGINTAIAGVAPEARTQLGLVLPLPAAVGAVLFLLGLVGNLLLTVVVLRTVAHDVAELDAVPPDVTGRLGVTAAFLFAANVVVGVAVGVGFILLVVPGIFLAVSLAFTQVYVAVEDEGPFEAMSSSWSLSTGNRFPLFGLGLVVVVISFLVGMIGSVVSVVNQPAGTIVQLLVSAPLFVFSNAALVDAFQQLRTAESDEIGAMTAEDLEEGVLNQNR